MTTAGAVKCACESCRCEVSPASAVEKDGRLYCSDACAEGHPDGKGCGHAGCDCG